MSRISTRLPADQWVRLRKWVEDFIAANRLPCDAIPRSIGRPVKVSHLVHARGVIVVALRDQIRVHRLKGEWSDDPKSRFADTLSWPEIGALLNVDHGVAMMSYRRTKRKIET